MRVIGRGAFGQVYKASWNGTDVALKELLPHDGDGLSREKLALELISEVKHICDLHHPNLCQFMGASVRGNLFIMFEFAPVGSLHSALEKTRLFRWKDALRALVTTARGVAYLHSQEPMLVNRCLLIKFWPWKVIKNA